MISHISAGIRRFRRWFSRSYWAIRLFRFPQEEGAATAPGLVLIQIEFSRVVVIRFGVDRIRNLDRLHEADTRTIGKHAKHFHI